MVSLTLNLCLEERTDQLHAPLRQPLTLVGDPSGKLAGMMVADTINCFRNTVAQAIWRINALNLRSLSQFMLNRGFTALFAKTGWDIFLR